MSDNEKALIGSILLGPLMIWYGLYSLKQYKKENYNPFKSKEKGYQGKLNMDIYFQSYSIVILGLLVLIIGIIVLFA